MPKCSIVPPARSIAAGMTSRRSAMAEAPAIRIISAPPALASAMACVTASTVWPQRTSAAGSAPSDASRPFMISSVLSSTLSLRPGRRVWIKATGRFRKPATRMSGPPSRAMAMQRSRSDRGTAKGMILTVAARSFGATTSNGARVADRDRLADQVDAVQPGLVDHQQARRLGMKIASAGKWPAEGQIRPGQRLGQLRRRLILADVAGFPAGPQRSAHGRPPGEPRHLQRTAAGLS